MDSMDTRTDSASNVNALVQQIKSHMPNTYKTILGKAALIGNEAFSLVRRGLRGEPNCFWAMEGGLVMGTPFNLVEVQRDIAQYMVTFGCAHVCVFQFVGKDESNAAR